MDNLFNLIYELGKNIENDITIRQLSIDSKTPYTTTLRLIKKNESLFSIKQKGNIKLISLNKKESVNKNYLIIAEKKKSEIFLKKNPLFKAIIEEIPKGNHAVILFGSRASEKQREKSDVDIMIVNNDGKKSIKFSKFELLHKLEVNTMHLKKHEFTLMLSEEEQNVAKEAVKNHVVFYGEEYFWNLIWNKK